MRKIFLITSILLLVSCKKENNVAIPNDITLQIIKGERLFLSSDEILKNQYFSFIKENTIPLYKCLVSKKYTIFTGIPYNTTTGQICQDHLLKNDFDTQKKQNENNYCYKISKDQKGNYIVEYAIKNKGQLYILASTKDTLVLNSKLSKEAFDKRLIILK